MRMTIWMFHALDVARPMKASGTSESDWDRVRAIAADIANAACADDALSISRHTGRMHRLLNRLRKKYGDLASILATKADYSGRRTTKLLLFSQAYKVAKRRHDEANLVLISSSIAQVYVEELQDLRKGQEWLERLRKHLDVCPDEFEEGEMFRLVQMIAERKSGS